jgi:hypothetical protein
VYSYVRGYLGGVNRAESGSECVLLCGGVNRAQSGGSECVFLCGGVNRAQSGGSEYKCMSCIILGTNHEIEM